MRLLSVLMVSLMLVSANAHATEEVDTLRQQLEASVARNAWPAADRTYLELVDASSRTEPEDHVLGARAAMAIGSVNEAVTRLERAGNYEEAQTLLADIRQRFGAVKLSTPGGHEGPVRLRPVAPMIDPLHRACIEAAKVALRETGRYKGLLPLGDYQLGNTDFEVLAGETAKAKLQ